MMIGIAIILWVFVGILAAERYMTLMKRWFGLQPKNPLAIILRSIFFWPIQLAILGVIARNKDKMRERL